MKRGIFIQRQPGVESEFEREIPEGAAITITVHCKECDWCTKAACGRKSVCDHVRIKAKRPYASDGENGRLMLGIGRPEWCPL